MRLFFAVITLAFVAIVLATPGIPTDQLFSYVADQVQLHLPDPDGAESPMGSAAAGLDQISAELHASSVR